MPPSYCSVKGCTNSRSPCCSLYCFPKDVVICKKWVDFCNRPELYKKYDENGPEYLYKSSRICSDHFQPADFNNPNLFSQGLKKGSVPSVNPANLEAAKPHGGNGGGNGIGSGNGGGGSGSSNGAGSPIDEKLLSAVASIPNLHTNLSLMMAAVAAAATQSASQNASQLSSLTASLKRSASAMSGGSMVAASQGTTASTTTPTATTPVSSSKRNRAVPPLAAPTGALANLIQRQQQIKEQQLKEQQLKDQQRKATALAALGLVNGQVSITPAIIGTPPSNGSSNNNHHHNNNNNGGPISLVTTKKSSANNHNNNNNNNNVSNHNHNHHQQSGKLNNSSSRGRLLDHSEYGLNMVDMDMTAGESSEGDSSYQNSADEDYAYHQKLKVAKVEAVIPPSLKSQLTVTPAGAVTNTNTNITTTINNNSIHNVNANGGGLVEELHIDYKEKYEQTLKELFACRKIVKNQNKAIQQQQKEIDFLNLLLKEK
ncbi:probable WRKY transcription factor protein 1 isoform X2 [Anopheles arabiensis]|uniref:probable WRKY transcription factor protein 1 isoform X2 n=1 Tax=Anopheles arabiensis TaxID=7173 RepID=UPI001AADB473|nr:probable WRKY transcription factor protein 1 isoform X2 [Anopheles arabiensis]